MWATKLFGQVVKRGKPIVKQPSRFWGRMIQSRGNAKPRFIVNGFGGPNLDIASHLKSLSWCFVNNVRPVVAGFTGTRGFKRLSSFPMRGKARFFNPIQMHGKMVRHVVHDVKTSRTVVKGFDTTPRLNFVVNGHITPSPMTPVPAPQVATERIVVQGFGINPSTPTTKVMNPKSERVVVKGFG